MTKSTDFVMPVVELVEEYEPTTQLGRKPEDNPFNDTVTALVATFSEELKRSKGAVKLVIPKGETRIRVTAKFAKAARAQGYTARFDDKATESGKAVIAAYLVPIINRTRKSKTVTVTHVNDSQTDTSSEQDSQEESNLEVSAS